MTFSPELMAAIRGRFAHVEECPFEGRRIFFENAGGALTLNTVVETSTKFAAIPDNQGRDNPASHALVDIIKQARADMALFFNAPDGQFFVGESGTELSFRLIRTAVMGSAPGTVIGSTVEHPASRSAAQHWADVAGKPYISVPHDNATGQVTPDAYAALMTPEVRVATILHTSPVTGIANDVAGISAAIRAIAPDAYIFVDGIQHASHGHIDIATDSGIVIARHRLAAAGSGAQVRDHGHVVALDTLAQAGASSSRRPHRRKERIPPGQAARQAAEALRHNTTHTTAPTAQASVIDLSVYERAAQNRTQLP